MTRPNVVPSGKEELLPHIYYSTRRIASGTNLQNTEHRFFNYVVGQTIDGIVATEQDTNIKKTNAVEQPNRFWLKSIDISLLFSLAGGSDLTFGKDSRENSGKNLLYGYGTNPDGLIPNSLFVLNVANKEKLIVPLDLLVAPTQISPERFQRVYKIFTLQNAELLFPEITFDPKIKIGGDIDSSFGDDLRIVLRFHGHLVRLADM